MKQTISFALLLIWGTLLLTGCAVGQEQNNTTEQNQNDHESYQILVYGCSDSIPEVKHELEYEFADKEKYNSIHPKESLEFSLNNEKISAEYVTASCEYRHVNYFSEYEYRDLIGNKYMFDNNGLMTFYHNCRSNNDTLEDDKVVSKEECAEIANNFIKEIIDTSDYMCSVEIEEWLGQDRYCVLFRKFIGEMATTDFAQIYLDLNGEIISYSGFMLNRIPLETNIADIDLDAAVKAVEQRLDNMYESSKDNYDRMEYSEPNFELTILKNGQRALITYIDVDCIRDEGNGIESHIGERIDMVVPLP